MPEAIAEPLSQIERRALAACEKVIESGRRAFVEVGSALAEIRDKRLYRDTHETFEAYCRERWDMSKTHANRLVGASGVVRHLAPIGVIPATESQCRALLRLPKSERAMAWQEVLRRADGLPVTADLVATIVWERLPQKADGVSEDAAEALAKIERQGIPEVREMAAQETVALPTLERFVELSEYDQRKYSSGGPRSIKGWARTLPDEKPHKRRRYPASDDAIDCLRGILKLIRTFKRAHGSFRDARRGRWEGGKTAKAYEYAAEIAAEMLEAKVDLEST